MSDAFLPDGYKVPEHPGNYMKFEEGDNQFRIVSNAIVGEEYWVDDPDNKGKRKPVRVRKLDEVPASVKNQEGKDRPKHFWAFIVFNRATETVQILEITQSSVQTGIEALVSSKGWGDPKAYDIAVIKKKTGSDPKDVEYSVIPQPKEPLEEGRQAYVKDMVSKIKLETLFDGGDPFAEIDQEMAKKQEINPADIPF